MTQAEYAKAARRTSIWHLKQEKKWRPKIKAALDQNIDSFVEYAKENSLIAAVKVIDTLVDMQPISNMLRSLYLSVGIAKAKDVRKQLSTYGKKSAFDEFLNSMGSILQQFFINYVITYSVLKILATQRKRILLYIAEQLESNIPEEQQQQSLINNPNLVQDALTNNNPTSTQEADILANLKVVASDRGVGAIARTEITRALNYAAYQAASKVPFYVNKTWLSLHDERTRRAGGGRPWDHWVPLGQTVPLESPYSVSGEQLMYPGDPTASAENIIGCRCGQEFSARLDSRGKPVLKPGNNSNITVILPGSNNNRHVITI